MCDFVSFLHKSLDYCMKEKNLNHTPSFWEIDGNTPFCTAHADFTQTAAAKRGKPSSERGGVGERRRLPKRQRGRCWKAPGSRGGLFPRAPAPSARAFCSRSRVRREEEDGAAGPFVSLGHLLLTLRLWALCRKPLLPTGRRGCSPHVQLRRCSDTFLRALSCRILSR